MKGSIGILWATFAILAVINLMTHDILIDRVTKLEQYKTSTEPIISGLNDEIKELRAITDEFRAQIKGLQKEVLIGIQEGYNGQ